MIDSDVSYTLTTNNNSCIFATYNCNHTCVPFSTICDGGNSRGLFDRFSPDKLLSRPGKGENVTKKFNVAHYHQMVFTRLR